MYSILYLNNSAVQIFYTTNKILKRRVLVLDKPTILLVDDDYSSRNITKLFLKESCNVETAGNGVNAIKMCRTKYYPLILMNIRLRDDMDGIQTTSEIKKIPGYEKIPIAAVTAYGFRSDRENLLSAGFSDYLAKPFSKKALIKLVEKQLSVM